MKRLTTLVAPAILGVTTGCYEDFSDPISVAPQEVALPTAIAVDAADRVHVSYEHFSPPHGDYIRSSSDGGLTWGPGQALPLEETYQLLADASDPDLLLALGAADVGQLPKRVHVARSTNGGATWSAHGFAEGMDALVGFQLSQNPVTGGIVAVWNWGLAFITRSSDGGATFAPPADFTPWQVKAAAHASDGTLIVALDSAPDSGQNQLHVMRSTNDGVTWGPPILVDTVGTGLPEEPDVALATYGSDVHVAYEDYENATIRHRMSTDGGLSFGQTSVFESGALEPYNPTGLALIRPSGTSAILLAWSTGENVHYRGFDGTTWSDARRMNNHFDDGENLAGLASDTGGAVYGAWSPKGYPYERVMVASSDPYASVDYGIALVDDTLEKTANRGKLFAFDYEAGNWGGSPGTVDVWVRYESEDGKLSGDLEAHLDLPLEVDEHVPFQLQIMVPQKAPLQDYDVTVYVGSRGWFDLPFDRDTFTVTVTR